MSDMDNMRVFADQLWKYMVPKLDSKFASNVSYFRAKVKTNLGNNTLEVQRPVENGTLTLPCTAAMSGATEGQQVTVLVMGSLSNAIVVGDGKMNGELGPLPIERGGTGETTALAALTALGGLSAKDFGTSLYSNTNINTLLTPGTYRCSTGAIAATIAGAPVTNSGFRLFVLVGHNSNSFVQIADIGSRLLIRSTADQGTTWTDWTAFSVEGHTHSAEDITDGVLPITKGGTGETTALAALTVLGGLSALDFGTILATNSNINTLLTPGTYYSPTGARSATITGAPTTGSGFRLFVMVGHNANTFVHIADIGSQLLIRSTADGGTTWTDWVGFSMEGHTHDYLPLSGGTLSGNLTIQRDAGTSSLILDSPEKTDVGRARTQLQKNASAISDNGTYLVDYVWGDGSSSTQRAILRVQASAAQLRDRLRLLDYPDGTSGTTYRLYGEHNQPTIADVTGLEARLAAIEDRLTALENG